MTRPRLSDTEQMRVDLAAYGARLGSIEPQLRSLVFKLPEIRAVRQELRSMKLFDLADRLRVVEQELEHAAVCVGVKL